MRSVKDAIAYGLRNAQYKDVREHQRKVIEGYCILGDPGAVSRVGRKGETNIFKYGQKSPWVPTPTELFPKIQADGAS